MAEGKDARYKDEKVELDADGIVIMNYRRPGDTRRIPYEQIHDFEVFEMGFWSGRHRLVGMPLARPRNWFSWDRRRRGKTTAIGLDVGRFVRPTVVPDDPAAVSRILREAVRP